MQAENEPEKCTVWKLSNPTDVILAKERSGLLEKNEGNTVKKIRSTEQILVLAILLFTYFLETFQSGICTKAENLPQIVSCRMAKVISQMGHLLLMAGV